MEVISDRNVDSIFTEGFAERSWQPLEVALVRKRSGMAKEATGMAEVRLDGSARRKNALRQSE